MKSRLLAKRQRLISDVRRKADLNMREFGISTRFLADLRVVTGAFMFIALIQSSMADGLVFQLPDNGVKAVFAANAKGTTTLRLPEHVKPGMLDDAVKKMLKPQELVMSREVSLASVGTEVISGGIQCRWLQIKQGEAVLLEVLVPESLCAPGFDTLNGSVRTFFNLKDGDRAAGKIVSPPGFDRIRYELERCRPLFPGPLKNQKEIQSEKVESEAGVFRNCQVITGDDYFEGALLANGYWRVKSTFKVWLHDEAPFGVVKVSIRSQSTEYSKNAMVDVEMDTELLLARVERDAARCLPEIQRGEQGGADQPAIAPESKPKDKEIPQQESEGRPK